MGLCRGVKRLKYTNMCVVLGLIDLDQEKWDIIRYHTDGSAWSIRLYQFQLNLYLVCCVVDCVVGFLVNFWGGGG